MSAKQRKSWHNLFELWRDELIAATITKQSRGDNEMIRETTRTWSCPAGSSWKICNDILKQTHIVIGGTTGSGKSTLLHSIMYSALIHSPARIQFVLIDLKGVELRRYRTLPHTIRYADEPTDAVEAIKLTEEIMRKRLNELKRTDAVMYNGNDIYLVIDELAVLMQTAKAKVLEPLSNIMRLGRATKVHVIGATQNPSRSRGGGLPAEIVQNATAAIALRCRSSIESRQIIGIAGAEKLPLHGHGLYWRAEGTSDEIMPMTSDKDLAERIEYWKKQNPKAERRLRWFGN